MSSGHPCGCPRLLWTPYGYAPVELRSYRPACSCGRQQGSLNTPLCLMREPPCRLAGVESCLDFGDPPGCSPPFPLKPQASDPRFRIKSNLDRRQKPRLTSTKYDYYGTTLTPSCSQPKGGSQHLRFRAALITKSPRWRFVVHTSISANAVQQPRS